MVGGNLSELMYYIFFSSLKNVKTRPISIRTVLGISDDSFINWSSGLCLRLDTSIKINIEDLKDSVICCTMRENGVEVTFSILNSLKSLINEIILNIYTIATRKEVGRDIASGYMFLKNSTLVFAIEAMQPDMVELE